MHENLSAMKNAMEGGDFTSARDLATAYVTTHPAEFTDYVSMVSNAESESEALAAVVNAVEALRNAGLVDQQYRAEAYILHRWEPQDIGGSSQPAVRNSVPPQVRNAN